MTEQERIEKYQSRFEELQEQLEQGTIEKYADDEEFKQCIDMGFGKAYNCPEWAISNYGRVYSLSNKNWNVIYQKPKTPNQKKTNTLYYYVGEKGTLVHKLVSIHFCDRTAVERFGIDRVQVDHYIPFDENKTNEENNYYKNLYWTEESDHRFITDLDNGRFENGKKYGGVIIEKDNTLFRPKGSHIEYTEDGKTRLIEKLI